jgi:hypothetical protein
MMTKYSLKEFKSYLEKRNKENHFRKITEILNNFPEKLTESLEGAFNHECDLD